jgi:hypothetical protein
MSVQIPLDPLILRKRSHLLRKGDENQEKRFERGPKASS